MSEQEIDFRTTLNLPQTDFSMRAGLAQKEPQYLEKWVKESLYEKIRDKLKDNKPFILHDGPPYANGNIHIGHALNKILKDFIIKFRTMQGFNSVYVPGWDCHGLPIEHQLLKEMKQRKGDVDCVDFRKKAYAYAMKYVGIQREQFQRLGVFGEWDHPYLTLDKNYEYSILKSLAVLNDKGYVYRGLKPVNWCFQCETALAEAEVEYEDHTSKTVFVKFRVNNAETLGIDGISKLSLVIWTTTPWTLLANVAVAVHPSFEYSIINIGSEAVIIEKSLAGKILEKAGIADFKVMKNVTGEALTVVSYQHPFEMLKNCKVVTADYVTKEDGTGLVHTAPGHGQEDFQTGLKHKLDVLMPVDDRGVYTQQAGSYAGQHVFKANEAIIEQLRSSGALLAADAVTHQYPHCWRCKNPIIFRATKQWFLNVEHEGLRQKLQEIIRKDVKWIPEAGQERILGMVTLRPDWCLSRQRYWGVPIPALKRKSDGQHCLYNEVINYFADLVKKHGTDVWFEKDVSELIPAGFKCPETGETEFEKTFDILDVWFDSGVSSQAVVKSMMGYELPIDLYLEGSDQHRGWFQSSLIPAVAMEGKAPFRSVLTHGFVVDGNGRKMSKSLGNVVTPDEVINTNGVDILRLWVAASSYNEDIRISKEIMARLVDAYRKIRNTIRYLLGNLYDYDPKTQLLEYKDLPLLDQWALYRLGHTVQLVYGHYEAYDFSKVYKAIYRFCNEDLSSFYLDILKDRLYTSAANSPERRAAQTVLYHVLNHLVRIMAPILMFTAEEVFWMMPKDEVTEKVDGIHLCDWLPVPEEWMNAAVEKEFELLIALRPYVLKALEDQRREDVIGSSLEAKIIFQTASQRDFDYLKKFEEALPESFIVSQVEVQFVDSVAQGLSEQFAQTQIVIKKADGKKCSRSWKYSTDVGRDPDFPTLSLKSASIVKEILNAN